MALYNGRDSKPVYVGYKGKVFDLSQSFLWANGKHQVLHKAGLDLTKSMNQAPHGEEFLFKFPVVGIILEDSQKP